MRIRSFDSTFYIPCSRQMQKKQVFFIFSAIFLRADRVDLDQNLLSSEKKSTTNEALNSATRAQKFVCEIHFDGHFRKFKRAEKVRGLTDEDREHALRFSAQFIASYGHPASKTSEITLTEPYVYVRVMRIVGLACRFRFDRFRPAARDGNLMHRCAVFWYLVRVLRPKKRFGSKTAVARLRGRKVTQHGG